MNIRTIRHYFREAFSSVIKNRLMSVASIFTVASCIFIVSVFFIVGSHVSFFVQQLGDTLGLVVFIEDGLSPLEVHRLEGRIRDIPHVTSVRYVSQYEALEDFMETLGEENAGFIAGIELSNPMPCSFVIEIADITYQEGVVRAIDALTEYGVYSVRRDADLANILTTLSDVVSIISIALILMLGIVAIVIITNTIHITVNARRTDINIMKYVGATDWFIRWPFIIEGVIIGFVGALFPAIITWVAHDFIIGAITEVPELRFIQFLSRQVIFIQLFPFALALGTLIGLVGSGVSVRRHLKV